MGNDNNQVWKMIYLITQIGFTMLVTIFFSMGIGYAIDRFFGTKLL
ncbi:MAG: AtpZ/AtpI family protein, partial [Lachnospiraceae bacterium]|nr:AtpZ/AtpI family protein [Lachnospiraceae bacterium]